MSNAIMGVPLRWRPTRLSLPIWLLIAVIQLLPAVIAIQYGWYWAGLPLVGLLLGVTILSPFAGILILVLFMYIRFSLPVSLDIHPADLQAFAVIGSALFHRLILGRSHLNVRWVRQSLLLILVALGISLIGAFDLWTGAKNWLRHLQLFLLLIAVLLSVRRAQVFAVVNALMIVTGILSVINIGVFIAVGGNQRVFGLAGPYMATFAAMAALHAAVGHLLSKRRRTRVLWAGLFLVYLFALLATQTRAALLQLALTLMFLVIMVWNWSGTRGNSDVRRRLVVLILGLVVMALLISTISMPLFDRVIARISRALEGRSTTIGYRLFLWKTGLRSFLDSPLSGIGLGQIQDWDRFLDYWRFDPMSLTTRGLGAHNDFITYLAETGLIGISMILWFFWRVFRRGAILLSRLTDRRATSRLLMLWIPVCALIFGFFFRTHMFYSESGMLTAIYFALFVRYTEPDADPSEEQD